MTYAFFCKGLYSINCSFLTETSYILHGVENCRRRQLDISYTPIYTIYNTVKHKFVFILW